MISQEHSGSRFRFDCHILSVGPTGADMYSNRDRSRATGVRRAARRGDPHSHQDLSGPQVYINDPGVVSSSPVSNQVFNPERIIGQPP